ncbi:MAG: aminoglycoside phosphotransferase family protein [Lachnospiraceae bacterium]|nr:aminoglycoside phosphotransferase family protein [Lachnospiraceae bacterium]
MEATNKEVIFTRPHKTIYATEDKIIKVFDNRYTKAEVLNEARNEALVEENIELNVPALLEVSKTEEGWCLVRDKVEGKTLEELMKENPEKLETYMEMFVDLQLEIHRQKVPAIKRLRHKLMDQINSLKDLNATVRYELATRLESLPRHTKLCHGDFNPSNVIVDKYGKLWIIDWAHAAQGNASADAAMTYLLFSLENKEKAEMYMKMFCDKSDTARQYVNRWLPIVAAAQMTKKKEKEKDFLMNWIDVAEYQ